jgi:hypothetical protein
MDERGSALVTRGSVAERVLPEAQWPVLTVKPGAARTGVAGAGPVNLRVAGWTGRR